MQVVINDVGKRMMDVRSADNYHSTTTTFEPLDFSLMAGCLVATWKPGAQIFFTKEETDDLRRVLNPSLNRPPVKMPTQL